MKIRVISVRGWRDIHLVLFWFCSHVSRDYFLFWSCLAFILTCYLLIKQPSNFLMKNGFQKSGILTKKEIVSKVLWRLCSKFKEDIKNISIKPSHITTQSHNLLPTPTRETQRDLQILKKDPSILRWVKRTFRMLAKISMKCSLKMEIKSAFLDQKVKVGWNNVRRIDYLSVL